MKIINLTPHPLVIRRGGDHTQNIPSSGIARCEQIDEHIGEVDGIPVVRTKFGEVTGLPPRRLECKRCGSDACNVTGKCPDCGVDGCILTIYVVSYIAAQAVLGRDDVYFPAQQIRDEQGRIIACAALGRI